MSKDSSLDFRPLRLLKGVGAAPAPWRPAAPQGCAARRGAGAKRRRGGEKGLWNSYPPTARDRVKLFHLAWDVAGSAFGSRQVLYERFFASDPLTRARALIAQYPKAEAMARVREFLERDDDV